jgi:hypothetical protein
MIGKISYTDTSLALQLPNYPKAKGIPEDCIHYLSSQQSNPFQPSILTVFDYVLGDTLKTAEFKWLAVSRNNRGLKPHSHRLVLSRAPIVPEHTLVKDPFWTYTNLKRMPYLDKTHNLFIQIVDLEPPESRRDGKGVNLNAMTHVFKSENNAVLQNLVSMVYRPFNDSLQRGFNHMLQALSWSHGQLILTFKNKERPSLHVFPNGNDYCRARIKDDDTKSAFHRLYINRGYSQVFRYPEKTVEQHPVPSHVYEAISKAGELMKDF